ncbi:MAG TPA: sugar transferase [Solirubrobacteraceae bacterium]|nr:sugar transferase [Solirubrobacteraceae bacterium]
MSDSQRALHERSGGTGLEDASPPRLAITGGPADDEPRGEPISVRYARMADAFEDRRQIDLALRTMDFAIAALALLVAAPLMAIIAVGLWATAGRPVLYRGDRIGRAGATFSIVKFRTLLPDAEQRLGPYLGNELLALTAGEATRVGRFLRETQLDELPQLWCVLTGRMSIVGPRPIRPRFFEQLCEEIPQYWQRLVVPPGITGFAQLRMTREMTWAEKLVHDLEYIADRSVRLYLRVVLATLARIARRCVASLRPTRDAGS